MGRAIKSVTIISGTDNIPVAFDTTAGSRVLTDLGTTVYTHAMILNLSTTALSVVLNGDPDVAPSATTDSRAFVNASSNVAFDDISIGDAIYVQSEGAAITSGTVQIMVW